MVRPASVLLLIAAGVFARPVSAQSTWEKLGSDIDNFADDVIHVWTSPARADAADVAGFAAISGSLVLLGIFDDDIQNWIREHPNALPVRALGPMRDPEPLSLLGYTHVLVPLGAGLYAAGLATGSDDLREAGVGCITSDISNTLARHLIARLLGRLRPQFTRNPYVIEPLAWGDWEMRSFPGGHAANIMACSSFWNNRFDLGIAEPLIYTLATMIGFGRTVDQAHWTTDTVFGLVFGWAVGRIVADRFRDREDDDAAGSNSGVFLHHPPLFRIGWRIRF